jgi:hypothetical protein
VKRTPVLRRIAAVLGQGHLHAVAPKHCALVGRVGARDDAEPEHALVKWKRGVEIGDRERHRVPLVAECPLQRAFHGAIMASAARVRNHGKTIFRFDTFGDEQLWTDVLQMQHVVADLSPATALSVGLKVDADALPASVIRAIKAGQVDLNDPAVTVQLLKLNAVVGVMGKVVGRNDTLATVGITCALCHSTVDDSVAPGIGRRLDGWANRTLNVGAIVALSPAVSDKATLRSWGPGRYDPRFHIFDGTNLLTINSPSIPVVIPPAFGLQGVGFETVNGDGPISYWNSYVGVTQMGGHGSFSDSRIGVSVTQTPDLVTPKLPALLQYQLSRRSSIATTPRSPLD